MSIWNRSGVCLSPVLRVVLPVLLALLLGCAGYEPVGVPAELGSDIQIEMLENRSAEPGLERLVADALQEEFTRQGALQPRLTGRGQPDALTLSGELREVSVRHTAYSSVALALEDEVVVVLDVRVRHGREGQVLWQRDDWSEAERFTASADPNTYESNKTHALRRLASELAERIHDELLQSF